MIKLNNKCHWTGNCCYHPDHDVLTIDGWIPIKNLTLNNYVACL
jgi:hypothetical protein